MLSALSVLLLFGSAYANRPIEWTFVQNGTSGIIPLELITISPTLMLMYDRADGNPLTMPDGTPAWAGLWHLDTNTATPLNTATDTFCAGGSFISNGTLVAIGGQALEDGQPWPPQDGRMAIRHFGPCTSPDGTGPGCTVFEDPENLHLQVMRWYPTAVRIPDGGLMVIGGSHGLTMFNVPEGAENTIEFVPTRKGETALRPSKFLEDTIPANLFPRAFVLPTGDVFVIANNRSMIYNIEKDREIRLPDLPNGVRCGVPFDGMVQLLPLSPPHYEPTVLVCGGHNISDQITPEFLSVQDPATTQCSRMTLTPAGIAAGWEVDHMPEQRLMPEGVLLPNGDVLVINGAHTGYSGYAAVADAFVHDSNAMNPAQQPWMYHTEMPIGQRFTSDGIPMNPIPRMYHSAAALTGSGNVMVAASNPHQSVVEPPTNLSFPTEFRVQYLNPDFITHNRPRPIIHKSPTKLLFNQKGSMGVTIPDCLAGGDIKISLMDMGFITHAWHANSRLVYLEHKLRGNTLEIIAPPNNNVYPPGPAWIYVVVDGVWSEGVQIMIGDGGDPPRPAQGVQIDLPRFDFRLGLDADSEFVVQKPGVEVFGLGNPFGRQEVKGIAGCFARIMQWFAEIM
ncbi:glyoxal oxidase N-terminus-domain-containing protein [Roridomyces roridus]|uniref:Glyoxal oxidase N-terminus-domain-containing protein n=1 Tax=Roridomyces roridus TaxID=1738132 RepID=A0AAD7B4J0_9AGAR|nr:glyoxal oxidase N-terminus-domain-containing protein [Roridomyces roridus]